MTTDHRRRTAAGLLWSLALLAAAPVTAHAANEGHYDKKILTGTACKIWGGQSHLKQYLEFSQFGRAVNTHPTLRLGVVCPVIRDETQWEFTRLRVYVRDENNATHADERGKVHCRLRSVYPMGHSEYDGYTRKSSASGTGSYVFTFDRLNMPNTLNAGAWNESPYVLFCLLPAVDNGNYSYLGSMSMTELGYTNND